MASDAVGLELVSKVVGYKITKGNFGNSTPNLPQSVAIIGEANTANQGTLSTTPVQITSAQQAGNLYGFGSPIYLSARILFPNSGSGIGGIPVFVYPQAAAGSSTAKTLTIAPVGTATANVTHTLIVAGRDGLDGVSYDFTINVGDVPAGITVKMQDALNNVLGSPFIGTSSSTVTTATAKWTGLTSQDLSIAIDTNGNSAGITYSVTQTVAGAGTPSIAASLALFENNWHTIVLNTYGAVTSIMNALEAFNGIPDPANPTGRYSGIIMKPFFAFTGSTLADPSTITDTRQDNVTIVICPAPGSAGLPFEAAANCTLLQAVQAQNNPHLDISGMSYPDMPTPVSIGVMSNYVNRDAIVKKGSSTVELVGGRYRVCDFVTTYHPDGEVPPQFRYVRSLVQDFNVRYGYYLLEIINVVDHAIASNTTVVTADKVVKPMMWIQILRNYASDLALRGIIVEPAFMQDSLVVNIGTTNPDRFETFFRYKRSGFARISSTTAEAGFNFNN